MLKVVWVFDCCQLGLQDARMENYETLRDRWSVACERLGTHEAFARWFVAGRHGQPTDKKADEIHRSL